MGYQGNDDPRPLEVESGHEHAAELVRAAAAGDRRAAGEYFAQNLHRLSIAARKIAGTSADHGDLLGDALVIVLAKWAEGTGPTGNVNAYISKIMRNRLLDELKSPRSQVRHLEPDDDPPAQEDPRVRRIELDQEYVLVRRALSQLPTDQREALIATVIEGQKPRDLEARLGRPAASIYSLTKRAKDNLRRTTLRILLLDGARPECAHAAKGLPQVVGDAPEDTSGMTTDHYRTCRRCRRLWARFGALATLGLVPFLVVSDLVAPSPASASSEGGKIAEPANPAPSVMRGEGGRMRVVAGHAADLAGPITAAVGATLLILLIAAFMTRTVWFSSEPTADIEVVATSTSATTMELTLRFQVVDEVWHTNTLEIRLSQPIQSIQAPAGWLCTPAGVVVSCSTALVSASGGTFHFVYTPSEVTSRYGITLTAITDSGARVVGTAAGEVQQ